MITSILIASLIPPFSGLFLWTMPGTATYCQLTQVQSAVRGDCYAAAVLPTAPNGVQRDHFAVKGVTDGTRVVLKGDIPFDLGGTWGTATAVHDGFVLEVSTETGIHQVTFRRVSAKTANAAVARVAAYGAGARGSYDLARRRQATAQDLAEARHALPGADSSLRNAIADSIHAINDTAHATAEIVATQDSANRATGYEKSSLEYRVGSAKYRLGSAKYRLTSAIRTLEEARGWQAELHARIRRDSVYLVTR